MLGFAVSAVNRDVTNEGFLRGTATKITISQSVHQTEVEVVEIVSRSRWCRLRNAIAMILGVGVIDTWGHSPAFRDETFG